MLMSEITVGIPADTLEALRKSPDMAGAILRMAAADKLYEMSCLARSSCPDWPITRWIRSTSTTRNWTRKSDLPDLRSVSVQPAVNHRTFT